MKKKDLNDLKTKSIEVLTKRVDELEKEKVRTQIEEKMGKVKNVHLMLQIRRDIAKVKSIMRIKELAAKETVNVAS